jgi:hypothetical protein
MSLKSEKTHTEDVDVSKIQTSVSLARVLGFCSSNLMMNNREYSQPRNQPTPVRGVYPPLRSDSFFKN